MEGSRSQTEPPGEGTPPTSNGLSLLFPPITIWEYAPTVNTDDKRPFPSSNLPTELRLLVYKHLLVANGPRYLQRYRLNLASLHPNIVATCRLIRQEATPVLYGCNEFAFSNRAYFRQFAQFVYDNRQFLQHLSAVDIDNVSTKELIQPDMTESDSRDLGPDPAGKAATVRPASSNPLRTTFSISNDARHDQYWTSVFIPGFLIEHSSFDGVLLPAKQTKLGTDTVIKVSAVNKKHHVPTTPQIRKSFVKAEEVKQ
ncbi:hypothetical protein CERZMDRAFT_103454 [Cercospora zeae-maydis SCOH1-5]|uniref:Uncharacterized protein n=1 Tax=Cercospora zeae-maydis SCOH1-5 TaxID=717836 RepID=A0A6A6EY01_9PEZI|nr:hypothetical protein CERZMDRAFT_103454 [Cercospora zeae-maydis SCOH1-5]